MKNRILAMLLTLCMIVTLLPIIPVAAAADDDAGKITVVDEHGNEMSYVVKTVVNEEGETVTQIVFGDVATAQEANDAATPAAETDDSDVVGSGTWGGIDWTLYVDGTLVIAPTKGTPVPDKNAPTKRTYEVGDWRETVIYNSKGSAAAIGGAPYDMKAVKKLIIEEGVTKIGSFTCQFPNLTGEVVIPSTVSYIGQEAFHKTPITDLIFAESENADPKLCIANGAFKKILIEEVVLPTDREEIHIHHWAFGGCPNLKSAYIPASGTKFWGGEHIDYFDNFNSQSNVTWAEYGSIFTGCTQMETITFENEAVRDLFFAKGRQSTSEDYIVAYVGANAYNSLRAAIDAAQNGDTITLLKSTDEAVELPAGVILNKGDFTAENVIISPVAKIGDQTYTSLQAAIDAVEDGQTIELLGDITENVTITQEAGISFTIDGNGKTFTGVMTVFGNGRKSGTETLTIKNIGFVAVDDADSCIVSPDRTKNNAYSYSHNVTVENCSFTDPANDQNAAAIRHEDGGDENWTIIGCTVDSTMHSFLQVNNVEGKLTIQDCDVSSKNGANLNSCTNVEITDCEFAVTGYAIRAGVSSGGNPGVEKKYVLNNNTLKSACGDGDAVIMLRASAADMNLSMEKNVVSGNTHFSGVTAATTVTAEANYWNGESAPVGADIAVRTYYKDANLTTLGYNGLIGSGTEADPYLIGSVDELIWFRDKVDSLANDGSTQFAGKYFKLTADIDLAGINWNPIGTMSGDHGSFKGVFDGNGHTISNLTVEQAGDGLGLFARTAGNAVIKNLTLNNVTVKSTNNSNYVGGLVGNAYASTKIEKVHVTGAIDISGRGYIGGIAGHGYVVMDNVSVIGTGTISSTFWCAGGILGYAGEGSTNIMNAHVEGITVTSAAGGLGAIVGMAEDNNGTQPISGSNLSAKNVVIKTYIGAYGDAYANYALGYLYGGNPTSKLTGTLMVENVTVETSNGVTPEVNDAVATVNGVIYFDLASAIAAADNATVTLLRNITLNDTIVIPAGKTIILNLNGKTISQTKACTASYEMISNKGNLTITGNGKISFTDTSAGDPNFGWGSYTIRNEGTLVVENGTIEHMGEQAFATHMICAIFQYSGSTTINGGTISTPNYRSIRLWKGDMTINGGTFDGQIWVQAVDNTANLTINGGSFSPNGGDGSSVFVTNNQYTVALSVTGGTFETKIGASVPANLAGAITGGKFSEAAANGTNVAMLANGFAFGPIVDGYCGLERILKGSGTEADPYLINNVEDLIFFRDSVNAGETKYNAPGVYVVLTADIDMKDIDWSVNIGDDCNNTFDGIFDGKNFTIYNLNSTETAQKGDGYICTGLFGAIGGSAVIKNLTLVNVSIDTGAFTGNNVAAVVGFAYNCTGVIENVTVKGNIQINAAKVDGTGVIVGYAYGGALTVKNCVVDGAALNRTGSVVTGQAYVGGIIGYASNNAVLTGNTVQNLTVNATSCAAGGVAGILCNGGKASNNTVKNVTLISAHENWKNAVGAVAGTFTGKITVTDTTTENNSTTSLVGVLHANKPTAPLAKAAASINGVYYATLADALAAAADQKNIVIDLVANATYDISAWDAYAMGGATTETITINGNGYTLIFNQLNSDWNNVVTNNDAKLILNNMTLASSGYNNGPWNRYDINFGCDVELNNVTSNRALAFKADATLKNVKVNETNDVYAIWIQANGQNISIDGLTVNSAGRGIKIDEQYNDAPATVALSIANATFTTAKKAAIVVKSAEGANITASNLNIAGVAADSTNAVWVDEDAAATFGNVVVTGATVAQENVASFTASVATNGKIVGYYATLAAAIAAAQAGDTITLIRDIALSETITNTKKVTLDLNGKTITGTDNATGSFALITNKGELTITGNGKITLAATNNRDWNAYSSVISNTVGGKLIVNGGTIEHLGGSDMAYAIDNLTNGKGTYAETVINGGTIKSTYRAIRQFLNGTEAQNILTVNGGTIEGANKSIWMQDPSKNANSGKLTVGANATLKGDVYLFVTAGSTEWPVEVSIVAEALASGYNVVTGNVPAGYEVVNVGGNYGVFNGVAKIGTTYYDSLAEAFAAAQNGDEVVILVAGTYALTTSGKNITITGAVAGVVFDNIGAKNMGGASVTFNNVTFDYYPNVNYTGLQHSGNLVYNNCTFNGQVFLYGTSETFNNCIFNQNSADAYNVWTYSAKEVKFNECTFNSAGKALLVYHENASVTNNVTITATEFNASAPVDGKAAIEIDTSLSAGATITVDAATTATGFANGNVSGNSLWNNKKGNNTDANNDITVKVGDTTVLAPVTFVAKIGDIGYTSIAEAIAAAQADETVTILAGNYTTTINVNKKITVVGETDDLGNNLVKINGGITITADGAAVKNITASNPATTGYNCTLTINAKDVLVEGCEISDANAMRYSYTSGKVTFRDCTLTADTWVIHFDGSNGGEVIVENCEVNGWIGLAGGIKVTLKASKFNNGSWAGGNLYGTDITIDGCNFNNGFKFGIASDEATVNVTNSTMTGGNIEDLFYGDDIVSSSITVDGVKLVRVAKIGDTYYETLADALAAAADQKNIVIDLVADATYDISAWDAYAMGGATTKTITINGNGKKLTFNQLNSDWNNVATNNDAKLILNNMTIANSGKNNGPWNRYDINFGCNVELNNVTSNRALAFKANATLKNVTIKETNDVYAIWIQANGQEISIDGLTVNSAGRGIKIDEQYNNAPEKVELSIANATFTTAKKAAIVVKSAAGANITASNLNIAGVATDSTNAVWVDEDAAATFGKVVVTGATVAQENFEAFVASVTVNGVLGYYKTLQAAINAAQAGETITFLADITEDVTVNKSLTIDGAGFKYTGNISVKGSSTNVTVKNVNFVNGTGYAITTNTIKSITVEDCTVSNYGFGFLYANKTTPMVTVKNVTVSDCNYGFHWVYGTTATLENVTMTNVAYGLYVQNYAGKTINLKNCDITSIKIWERDGYSGTQTFNFEGVNTVSELPTSAYAKIVADAMIGNKIYENLADAFAAAQDGETIKLLADINATEAIVIDKAITLDGNGHKLTSTATRAINVNCAGDVTIKNLTVATTANTERAINVIQKAVTLTLDNVVAEGFKYTINVAASSVGSNITVNGGKFSGYAALNITGSNTTVVVNNAELNGINDAPAHESNGFAVIAIGDATVADPTTGVQVTVNGGKLTATSANGNRQAIVQATNVSDVVVSVDAELAICEGEVFHGNIAEVDASFRAVYADVLNAQGYAAKSIGNNMVAVYEPTAKIGNTNYATLADAIKAAVAGDTIIFLTDITENVTVDKSITIDGAGFKYTGNISVKGKANSTNVTVKNVNFVNGTGYAITTNTIKSITVENCTVTNYGYGFLYANKTTPTVTVKNVTVDGGTYGFHWVYGSTATLENVKMTNVAYGIMTQNYGAKTITIKDCVLDATNPIYVWEKATATDTFIFEGTNTVSNAETILPALQENPYAKVVAAAVIGNKVFGSLTPAIEYVADGATIKVFSDFTVDKNDKVLFDDAYYTFFKVEGKTVIIDLNGKKITGNAAGLEKMLVAMFATDNNGHLTLVDSKGGAKVELVANDANVYSLITNYESGCSITINGGTYILDTAIDSLIYSGCDDGVIVNGGNFTLGNVGDGQNGKPWIFNVLGGNNGNVTVNGGTFNADINHQFWANEVFVPETLALKNNGDGTWTIVDAVAYADEIATSTGSTPRNIGYATLAEAIAAANTTVTLLADIKLDAPIEIAGKDITLDLNGKKLTAIASEGFAGRYVFHVTGTDAKLTVKDSVGTGTVIGNDEQNLAYMFRNDGGAVIVDGGKFILAAVNGGAMFFSTNSDLVVNGGTFIQTTIGWMFNTLDNGLVTLTVNGGQFNRFFIGGASYKENIHGEVELADGKHLHAVGNGLFKVEDYTIVIDPAVAPDCTNTGLTEGSHCSVCGEVLVAQTVVPATGHDYGAVVTAPTCTTHGYTTHTCATCGDEYVDTIVDALGHNYVIIPAKDPTCTEKGNTVGVECDRCGHDILVSVEIPANGHVYGEWINKIAPTCTTKGEDRRDCVHCDHYETREVAALGHKHVAIVTAPTCTADGYTTHICYCGDTYTDSIVPALGHTEATDAKVDATCTTSGLTEGKHCSVCGEVLVAQTVVPATGHNHNAVVTAPTCTTAGYTTHTCACGDSYISDVVNALGHTEVDDAAVDATCTTSGLTAGKHCSVCGTITVAQQTVPAHGHNMVIVPAKAPTCTETGLTVGVKCATCGYELLAQQTVNALGHNYTAVETAPTYEADGYTTYTCATCDHSYTVTHEGTKLVAAALIGDTAYATLADALANAVAGNTIKLVADLMNEGTIVLNKGITLDLNGYTLKADSVIAFNGNHVVDNSTAKSGKLVVDQAKVALAENNSQMPIYNDGGYTFSTIVDQVKIKNVTDNGFTVTFRPGFETDGSLSNLFANGSNGTGVQFILRLSKNNGTIVTDYIFSDANVKTAYNGKALSANVSNAKTEIEVSIVLVSDTGVEHVYNAYTFVPVVTETPDATN